MSSDGFFVKPKAKKTNFDKPSDNRAVKKQPKEDKPSKPFNKRQWREKKYSTGYKLDQWKKTQMKSTLRQYYKNTKNDEPGFDVQKIYNAEEDGEATETQEGNSNILTQYKKPVTESENKPHPTTTKHDNKKLKGFKNKAHLEFQRIQDVKKQRKEELAKKLAEKQEKLKEYKKKKFEKFKKLNKKTKKGQPIMKDRIEMLLEQIQSDMSSDK